MNVQFRALVPSDMLTVKQHLPSFRMAPDVRGFVAYDKNSAETAAIFMMTNWTYTAAQAHLIIIKRMVLRHGMFEEMAHYMFDIANRQKIFVSVVESNQLSLSICRKFGFREYARMEDGWDDDVDCVLMELTREMCPWWAERDTAEAA